MTHNRDSTVILTASARDTITRMVRHVEQVKQEYGKTSGEYRETADSLIQALYHLVLWDDVRVGWDGELSLLCQSGRLVFGVIFHPDRRHEEDGRVRPGAWSFHS